MQLLNDYTSTIYVISRYVLLIACWFFVVQVCSFRCRALHNDMSCPMCRTPLDVVACTALPTKGTGCNQEPLFQSIMAAAVTGGSAGNSKKNKLVFNDEAKMHAPKAYMNSVLRRLNDFRCPTCGQV
jgi:predicted RNA-binding Zn-ribbon protein involved in translation (DUF1610 family)